MKQLPLVQINPKDEPRYYRNEDKPSLKYHSVTNILSKTASKSVKYGIDIWKQQQLDKNLDPVVELNKAAERGSIIHNWAEMFLQGEIQEIAEPYKQYAEYIKSCTIWKHVTQVLSTESMVCSDKGIIPFAGTFDALLIIKDKLCLFDFKTKNSGKNLPTELITNEALCQMAAYRICLKENYNIDVETCIALYVYPDQPAYPAYATGKDLITYANMWEKRLKSFAEQLCQ